VTDDRIVIVTIFVEALIRPDRKAGSVRCGVGRRGTRCRCYNAGSLRWGYLPSTGGAIQGNNSLSGRSGAWAVLEHHQIYPGYMQCARVSPLIHYYRTLTIPFECRFDVNPVNPTWHVRQRQNETVYAGPFPHRNPKTLSPTPT
jgi:hypothetical protein